MLLKRPDGMIVKSSRKNNGWLVVDDFQHFKTIDFRHLYVQKYDIRLVLHNCLGSFETVVALGHYGYLRIAFEVLRHHAPCQRFIIYQYRFHHNWGILIMLVKICVVA